MRRLLSLIGAVLLLDAALTFLNVWPTPAITWHGDVSVELAIVLALCAAFAHQRPTTNGPRPPSDL